MSAKFFYLEPYIHVNCQKEKVLLYNTFTNDFFISTNPELIKKLEEVKINRSAVLSLNQEVSDEVDILRKRFFGDYLPVNSKIPFIVPGDLVKVVRDKDFINDPLQRAAENSISHNLITLDIYLDQKKNEKDTLNNQCLLLHFPKENLIKDKIFNLIKTLFIYKNLSTINFYLSEINSLQYLEEVFKYIPSQISVNLHIRSFNMKNISQQLFDKLSNICLYLYPDELTILKKNNVRNNMHKFFIKVFVTNEEDLEKINITEINGVELEFFPYFNGTNLLFFKKYVFISRESLFEEKIKMHDIVRNSIVNTIDFGNLIVCADGSVFSNLFCKPLGNLLKSDFNIILKQAFSSPHSTWFEVRKNQDNCCNCIYNALCPPMGNYEKIFGLDNLCNITK